MKGIRGEGGDSHGRDGGDHEEMRGADGVVGGGRAVGDDLAIGVSGGHCRARGHGDLPG